MTTILVCDNDSQWVSVIKQGLELSNYSVATAYTVEDASNALDTINYDVAIIDIHMVEDRDENDLTGLILASQRGLGKPKIITTNDLPVENWLLKSLRHSIYEGLPAGIDFVHKSERLAGYINAITRFMNRLPSPQTVIKPRFGVPSRLDVHLTDVFVVMPFREELNIVYEYIKQVGTEFDLTVKRGDSLYSTSDIIQDIWSLIYNCKMIIADCSGQNVNVFYELGIADTLGRDTILLAQNIKDNPFDVKQRRFIQYSFALGTEEVFKNNLRNAIQDILSK